MSTPHGASPTLLGVVGRWHVLAKKGYRATGGRCEREVRASAGERTDGEPLTRAYSCAFCASTITTEPWNAAEGPGHVTYTQKRRLIGEHLSSCAIREHMVDVGMRLALWVMLPAEERAGVLTFSRPTLRAVVIHGGLPASNFELTQIDRLADLLKTMRSPRALGAAWDPVRVRYGLDEFTVGALLAPASTEAAHEDVQGPGDCSGSSADAVRAVPLRHGGGQGPVS